MMYEGTNEKNRSMKCKDVQNKKVGRGKETKIKKKERVNEWMNECKRKKWNPKRCPK